MADVEIKSRDLLILDEKSYQKRDSDESSREVLRVVQWWYESKDGSWAHSEKLERRGFFTKENDAGNMMEFTGKAKGLSLKDMETIKKKWGEVIGVMKNPPTDVPQPKQEAAPDKGTPTDDLEEVPF